jgi:DNA invertase Pin-like site-specific DNA recombinase
MITAKEIDAQLTTAIKKFGSYTYDDKGSSEVMELEPIISSFKESKDPVQVVAVLAELDRKRRNSRLVSDLISNLDNWEAPYGNLLFDPGYPVIKKYY